MLLLLKKKKLRSTPIRGPSPSNDGARPITNYLNYPSSCCDTRGRCADFIPIIAYAADRRYKILFHHSGALATAAAQYGAARWPFNIGVATRNVMLRRVARGKMRFPNFQNLK